VGDNRYWKRKLQALIHHNNHLHATRAKDVSHKTQEERAVSLFRMFSLLRRLGFQLDPQNLSNRHIQTLVDYWVKHERARDLCEQRGVEMLKDPHSAAHIQQQLSILRVFASWIAKRGMILPADRYVDNATLVRRTLVRVRDKTWEGNGIDFAQAVERIAAIDERVAVQLAVMLAFGLRRKEAIIFRPHIAVVPKDAVPATHAVSDSYAVFLSIKRGTKGGRLRFTAIRNEDQVQALERARQLAKFPDFASRLSGSDAETVLEAIR
jgi:Integrase